MRTLYTLVLAIALAACGGSSTPAATTPPATTTEEAPPATPAATTAPAADGTMAEALAQMESYTNQMCACTTPDCADLIMKAMTEWSAEFAKRARKDQSPTDDETKRMTDTSMRMAECAQKAMGAAQDK